MAGKITEALGYIPQKPLYIASGYVMHTPSFVPGKSNWWITLDVSVINAPANAHGLLGRCFSETSPFIFYDCLWNLYNADAKTVPCMIKNMSDDYITTEQKLNAALLYYV